MGRIVITSAEPYNYDLRDTARESITVEELIERLRDFPRDAKVVYRRNSDSIFGYFNYDSFREL